MKYILGRAVACTLGAAGFLAVCLGVWGFITGGDLDAGKLVLHLLGGVALGYAAGEVGVWLKKSRHP